MQLIDFNDTCIISRYIGKKDEFGNFDVEIVYEGACLYQESGQVLSYSIITRNPSLYIPSNKALVNMNDSVKVTTQTGRVIESRVLIARDVRLRATTHLDITKIELKQAMDK